MADREAEAQHGNNSIAAASPEQSAENPAENMVEESERQAGSSLGDLASAAAEKAKETATDAFGSVAGGSSFGSSFRKRDAAPVPSVYVGNLFFDVKEEDLREEFQKCGEIESIKLIMDNRGLSKGYVHIHSSIFNPSSPSL